MATHNVKRFGAKGNGTTDDTVAIQRAIDTATQSGGRVYFPMGTYKVTSLDLSQQTGIYDRHIALVGDGYQASKIKLNTAGIGIDATGAVNLEFRDLGIWSGDVAPSVGLLLARSMTSVGGANSCVLKNVQVIGTFVHAAIAQCGAELCQFEFVRVRNFAPRAAALFATTNGLGLRPDGNGGYEQFTISTPKGQFPGYGGQCNNYYGCQFTTMTTDGVPIIIEQSFQGNFRGCYIGNDLGDLTPQEGEACVLVSAENSTTYAGPLVFDACNFEGSGKLKGILLARTQDRVQGWFDIHVRNCYFCFYGDRPNQFSIDYAGPGSNPHCLMNSSYLHNARSPYAPDRLRLNYLERSNIFVPWGYLTMNGPTPHSEVTVHNPPQS